MYPILCRTKLFVQIHWIFISRLFCNIVGLKYTFKVLPSVIVFEMRIVWYLGDSCIKVHWSSGSNFMKIQSFRSKKPMIENYTGSYGKMHLL